MPTVTQPSPTFPSYPNDAAAVTPHDTNKLSYPSVIYVGVGGNVKVTTAGGTDVTFTGVQTGDTIPVRVIRVFSTGTTATTMIAIF